MSLRVPRGGGPQLFKDGYKSLQGVEEAVVRNIYAIQQLGDIVRTCMGPHGSKKLVMNQLQKVFLTSDTATIIKELDVVHPAAKLCAMATEQQDIEVGDCTNFVMVIISEWLKKAEGLLRIGLHPLEIITGYEKAAEQTFSILDELVADEVTDIRDSSQLVKALKSCIASKQAGQEDFLAELVSEAALTVMPKNLKEFNVDTIRVVKIMGSSLQSSKVLRGMIFNREPESFVKNAKDAKVAVFTNAVDISQMETKGTVLLKSAKEMLEFSKGEQDQLEQSIKEIYNSGIRVIVTGGTFGELALHYIDRYGLLAVKIPSKFDLRRFCRVCGATPLVRFGAPMPEEMGYINSVETLEIGADRVVCFSQDSEKTQTSTIILRGATQSHLDDLERAIDDSINVIKAIIEDKRLLAGAGAVEMQLSRRLQSFALKNSGVLQLSIKSFAEAFEVVPRTLADNSGLNSNEVLSRLYAAHGKDDVELSHIGVDIDDSSEGVLDALENQIFDSYFVKQNAIKLAVDATLTILRIDQIVMSRPATDLKPPSRSGNWDNDD